MTKPNVIDSIRQTAASVLPKGSRLYLYGSQARGDSNEDSDWDLLILTDDTVSRKEKEDIEFAFVQRGWDINEDISARAYSRTQWYDSPHTMFYFNVEEDKKLLYES